MLSGWTFRGEAGGESVTIGAGLRNMFIPMLKICEQARQVYLFC